MTLAIFRDERLRLTVGQIRDALLTPEVELHPHALIGGIDHGVSVAAEALHMSKALRKPAIRHDNRDLMQRLRQQRPEIPVAFLGIEFDRETSEVPLRISCSALTGG
ncbi:MAG: hypothetical protein JWL65_5725 [Gammaproteobacteria bacterium]|nr:hypothetical protein [Gammaproteobacteria bacterium]